MGIARKGLFRATEMRAFGGVDSSESDVNLCAISFRKAKAVSKPGGRERTVLSFNSFFVVGTFFHGNQPHPASLPPGVWYILKLSPSPTLVT